MDSITRAAYEQSGVDAGVSLPPPLDPLAFAGRLRAEAARRAGPRLRHAGRRGHVRHLRRRRRHRRRLRGTAASCWGARSPSTRSSPRGRPFRGSSSLGIRGKASCSVARRPRQAAFCAGSRGSSVASESALVEAAAELEPGSGGVLALPYLAGERAHFPIQGARGAHRPVADDRQGGGLPRGRRRPGALRRVDRRAPAGARSWRASGGGCRNPAWLRATCDALGAQVEVIKHAGEAVGPAVLALRSVGLEPPVGIAATVKPRADRTRRYEGLYARYRELGDRLRER